MNKITIAINNSFYTYNLFPLYYNFFVRLGCEVILPTRPTPEGLNYEFSQFCYPMQLSLQLFYSLIGKADYYFVPAIFETDAECPGELQRLDFNCACAFVTGEPYILRQAFKEFGIADKMITPSLNFNNGYRAELQTFIKVAKQLGIHDEKHITCSYMNAVAQQEQFQQDLYTIGKRALAELTADEYAIVLIGRSYNSFTDIANKGIPRKFASRGVTIIPFDMLDVRSAGKAERMYWEVGHRIINVAKLVQANPQLFPVYITNFSCAPDSMLLNTFRQIMKDKPALVLELDSHSADAGINTRIDAFIDIIDNYRREM